MAIRLIQDPYDSGNRELRMGRGPGALVENGVVERLTSGGGPVASSVIELDSSFPIEMATTFGVLREIAREVREARESGQFPLILAGSCNSTVGALAGIDADRLALIWFDAHGDFHTPETTTSGFMGGLPVSIVVGHCWRSMAASIPGFRPLAEDRVVMVGLRDVDPGEEERFAASEITVLRYQDLRAEGFERLMTPVLDAFATGVDGMYVHLDLDVCDPVAAPVNPYQPPGGLSPEEVKEGLRFLTGKLPILGASVTAYDPACDPSGRGLESTLDLVELLGELVG